ncbi:MAG: glutamine synthetase [Oligoflexales bacterium]|nr:glutamine synthetase [Oligoflexales bacterium]
MNSSSKDTQGSSNPKNFLELSYVELEQLNLLAKEKMKNHTPAAELREHYTSYLSKEPRLKAVTLCFTDIEGRFHMLDYDKKFLLKNSDNLTFDGSSVRGFSQVDQSDLRLEPDWGSLRWLPCDVFGPGKVIMFAGIKDAEGNPYSSDMRSQLKMYTEQLRIEKAYVTNFAVECEGFLLDGLNAEQNYQMQKGFDLVSSGGYYHSLPKDKLRLFIDEFAEAQRAMGFENEKDHPEVAPSQFELNYTYTDALIAADLIQIYKLLARQIAANSGLTASFLPKPIPGINGSGMHCNISLSHKGKNIFYSEQGPSKLSALGWDFIEKILYSANDLSLALNPSVNAYRRLDPHFEAPNQIKSSANDRTSMVRIPLGNEHSSRIEVRSVAPDVNPYMAFLLLLRTGLEGPTESAQEQKRARTRVLPGNIQDAIKHFKASEVIKRFLGEETQEKYVERKIAAANRCAKELGSLVKTEEVIFHHEVTNQFLWSRF